MNAVHSHLRALDYSVVQQWMHCGLCLPTCPTYDATRIERHSPRGRISLMRAITDGRLETTATFAAEMYSCLGCLACMSACPAGVNYAALCLLQLINGARQQNLPIRVVHPITLLAEAYRAGDAARRVGLES